MAQKISRGTKAASRELAKVRKANEALAGGKGSNSTASEDYKSEAERKAEQAEARKAAVAARKAEVERKRQEAQKIKTLKLLSRLNKPSPMLSLSRTTADTLTKICHIRILCVSNMILSSRVSMSR